MFVLPTPYRDSVAVWASFLLIKTPNAVQIAPSIISTRPNAVTTVPSPNKILTALL
jgi:hypothetical protein